MLLNYMHGTNQMNVVRWKDVVCIVYNIIACRLRYRTTFVTVNRVCVSVCVCVCVFLQ